MKFLRVLSLGILLRSVIADDYNICGTVKPTPEEQIQAEAIVAKFEELGGLQAQQATVKIDTYWHTIKSGSLGNTDQDVANSMKVLNDATDTDENTFPLAINDCKNNTKPCSDVSFAF